MGMLEDAAEEVVGAVNALVDAKVAERLARSELSEMDARRDAEDARRQLAEALMRLLMLAP